MAITILNTVDELNSFPSSQSIFLTSTDEVEENNISDNIVLFRLQTENQLINLAEPYSYNLGYLKETFDRVELSFKIDKVGSIFNITCTPTKLLNLDSLYCLYISNTLSHKFLDISKINSKSNSNISIKIKDKITQDLSLNLKIEETSYIVNNKNIVKVNVDGRNTTVDVRKNNTILSSGVEIILEDTIYVKDEEFKIDIKPSTSLTEDLQTYIKTVLSSSIKPIPKEEISTSISNSDILNFYNTLNKTTPSLTSKVIPKYLDTNVFSITLPDGYKIDDDKTKVKASINVAFNNYMLSSLGLYDKELKYIVNVILDDFENEIIFEVIYSTDQTQTEQIILNFSGFP